MLAEDKSRTGHKVRTPLLFSIHGEGVQVPARHSPNSVEVHSMFLPVHVPTGDDGFYESGHSPGITIDVAVPVLNVNHALGCTSPPTPVDSVAHNMPSALAQWRDPWLLSQAVLRGQALFCNMITTDTSHQGWGELCKGYSLQCQSARHINYLELLMMYMALRHLLPCFLGRHVLVRSNKMTTVAYSTGGAVPTPPCCGAVRICCHFW